MSTGMSLHLSILWLGLGCGMGLLVAVDNAELPNWWQANLIVIGGRWVSSVGMVDLVLRGGSHTSSTGRSCPVDDEGELLLNNRQTISPDAAPRSAERDPQK